MPTTRPRYRVTETPVVARALEVAAKRWPDEPRSKLLLRLVDAGRGVLEREQDAQDETHHAAVMASSGRYPEAFAPGYRGELQADLAGVLALGASLLIAHLNPADILHSAAPPFC